MKNITDIFFDLDHTLWDFDKNAGETLTELFHTFRLDQYIENKDAFIATYQEINAKYWNLYNHGKATKEDIRTGRFKDALNHFEVPNAEDLALEFGNEYVRLGPWKTNVFPNAHETLTYLKTKYRLHIITNGFKEVQYIKLDNCQLTPFFDLILCSEDVGKNKPHAIVFETALSKTNARPEKSIMIGDNPETDIRGAQNCGIQTILFNPHQYKHSVESSEIRDLKELVKIL